MCNMGMLPFCLSPSTWVRTEIRKSTILYYHFCNKKPLRLSVVFAFPMVIQLISEFRFNLDLKPSNISVIILYFPSWYSEVWWSTEARVWKCLKKKKLNLQSVMWLTVQILKERERKGKVRKREYSAYVNQLKINYMSNYYYRCPWSREVVPKFSNFDILSLVNLFMGCLVHCFC